MNREEQLASIRQEMREVLENNILNYWKDQMVDHEHGGFYGRRDGNDRLDAEAPKSAILNGRILWAFSAAYRVLEHSDYLELAQRARNYILDCFLDKAYSGCYWTVDASGHPLDTKKHVYAIAVVLYGLTEYVRATGDGNVLQEVKNLFYNIEAHVADAINDGYTEAKTREWASIHDVRLSEKDEATDRSLNVHLHLLEAYTGLYRIWPAQIVASRLRQLMGVMLEKMVHPASGHLGMFFSEGWQSNKEIRSYGHDIEAAWLILDAARALNDPILLRHIPGRVLRLVAAADEGLRPNGGMIYQSVADGQQVVDTEDYHWWVQAESVVGHWYAWLYLHQEDAFDKMSRGWDFLKTHLIDREHGEWFWSCDAQGTPNRTDDKAGIWKDPCHNTRMCLAVIG